MMASPLFLAYLGFMGLILFAGLIIPLVYRFSPSLKLVEWMYKLPPWRWLPRGSPELPDRARKIAAGDWVKVQIIEPGSTATVKYRVTEIKKGWGDTIVRYRSESVTKIGEPVSDDCFFSLRAQTIERVKAARRLHANSNFGENKFATIGGKQVSVFEVKEKKIFRYRNPDMDPKNPLVTKNGNCTIWHTDVLGVDGTALVHCVDDGGGVVYSMEVIDFGGADGNNNG